MATQNPSLAASMFDATTGLLQDGVTKEGTFASCYTSWLTYVFNNDQIQNWLCKKGVSYNDNSFSVSLNQNSGSLLPTITYLDGTTVKTVDQSLVDQIFGEKDSATIATGKTTQERSYVSSFDAIENTGDLGEGLSMRTSRLA